MSPRRSRQRPPLETFIAACGGTARQNVLASRGYSSRSISQAVADGRLVHCARGVYGLPEISAEDAFLASHQARRSCLSAVTGLGLWLLTKPGKLHVATAHGRPVPGCVSHRVSGRQSLMDILHQCVKCGSELEALIVLESAVVTKKCSINSLRTSFSTRSDAAGRAIVDMIDPQSMAITETCCRYTLRAAGYNVQGQAYIRNAGHLDILVDGILGLEIDGEAYHNDQVAWKEDLRRDTMYVLEGMWRLRIPAAVALYQPHIMLGWVEQALKRIRATQLPGMR
ncbi:hypothetical protein [Arthrobacter psychrolactophilus]|uniref:hypothetical protein n=1 Tax=Arthrobacter psychrolactophilus TaxID=92442 RepID=UPI0011B40CA3|nr:hypothetical protein [Arthrobacter psychrolactophilus]